MALRHLIQNKLRNHLRNSELFRKVTYNDDGDAELSSPVLGTSVLSSAHANEIGARFEQDSRNKRAFRQERSEWLFELRAKFNQEIDLEDVEEAWLDDPPVLTRDDTSSKQVTLLLLSTKISHPPQQSSSTGTEVAFTIQALLSRQ